MSGAFPVKGKRRIFIGLLFKLPRPTVELQNEIPTPKRIIYDKLYLKSDKVYQSPFFNVIFCYSRLGFYHAVSYFLST